MKRLTIEELQDCRHHEGIIIDTRPPKEFASGYVPESIYFNLQRGLPSCFERLVDKSSPLIWVSESGSDASKLDALRDKGYQILGSFLFDKKEIIASGVTPDLIIEVDADEFGMDLRFDEKMVVADLRKYEKFADGHVRKAISFPLEDFEDITLIADLDERGCIYLYSDNEDDPMTAASILKKFGLHELRVVSGGWKNIKKEPSIVTAKNKSIQSPARKGTDKM